MQHPNIYAYTSKNSADNFRYDYRSVFYITKRHKIPNGLREPFF